MTEKKQRKSSKKRGRIVRILAGLVASVVVLAIIGASVAGYYVYSVLKTAPTLNIKDFESVESSQIFDKDGVLIADIGEELRSNVTYADLPQVVVDAFISIEDSRYFAHNGFDLPRFTKAAIENIQASLKTGKLSFEQGGSTFTMQLVKNTYFTTKTTLAEKSVPRKIKEIYLALQLDKQISKKRVLELYLNKINFGAGSTRGIQNAALYYFGKDVSQINLSEAAFLAGVINAPAVYSPFGQYGDIEKATKKRNEVLNLMAYHGYITADEEAIAKSIKLEDLFSGGSKKIIGSPYQAYVDTVITEVQSLTGLDPYTTPMKIYTSMDRALQDKVEAIQNGTDKLKWPNEIIQTAIVTLNNKTGEIVAMGGGRFYQGERLFNRATTMKKQPGSSLKPVMPYALAFEYLGYSTQQVILDEPFNYAGTDIIVTNFDERYNGQVTLTAAVARSLNIPSLKTLQAVINKIGAKKVIAYLNSVGFTQVNSSNFDLGYAIGGSSFEVTPVQEAGAHAAIINGGNYIQPHTINRIEFKDGSEPLVPAYASTKVISEDAAYISTYLMENNVSGPYLNFMQILRRDYPVYAKTGTSDWGDKGLEYGIPFGAIKDRWMVASTSQFTTAIWVGYDKAVKGQASYIDASVSNMNIAGNINKLILNQIYSVLPKPVPVKQPAGVVSLTHVLGVFPYVAPVANMNPALIVTGLIKADFATLGTLSAPTLSNPATFTESNVDNGTKKQFTFTLSPYPTPEALSVAPPTLEMSLTVGSKTVKATGKRLYDSSWIFGAVQYKVRVTVNGLLIGVYAQSTNVFTIDLGVSPGSTVSACGYYGYELSPIASTEICKDTIVSDIVVDVPNNFSGRDYVLYTLPSGTTAAQLGKISSISPAIEGTTMNLSALMASTIYVTIIDKRYNLLEEFLGKTMTAANLLPICDILKNCTPKTGPTVITQVKLNDVIVNPGDTYLLSEIKADTITFY
jgi:penicillin-binding protein 1A